MSITIYTGTHDGTDYQSVFPNVYRARYRQWIAGREYPVDAIVTGASEIDVRARITKKDVRGSIMVEHVATLTPQDA